MVRLLLQACGMILLLLGWQSANGSPAKGEMPGLTLQISSQQPWQREQVIVSLSLQTDDTFAHLEVAPFKQPGFVIVPLDSPTLESNDSYTLQQNWAVFPLLSGKQQLTLPRVRYRPSRGRIKTLQSPTFSLRVKPLPVYIPPTMPVGQISLQSQWQASPVITPKQLYYWQLTIQATDVAPQTLPGITRQLVSGSALEFLPPQRQQKQITTDKGLGNEITYLIPLKAKKSGVFHLPAIEINYFDARQGKLQTARLAPPYLVVLNSILQWILALAGIAIVITLLLLLSQKARQKLSHYLKHREIVQSIAQATDYKTLRESLNQLAVNQGWGENLTLAQIQQKWQKQSRHPDQIVRAIQALQVCQFSSEEMQQTKLDIRSIAGILVQAVTARPVRRGR